MNKDNPGILKTSLNDFETISLDDLSKVKLLNRHDTKFIFNQKKLPSMLEEIKKFYRVLKIETSSIFKYNNTYFDTDDFLFYNQHHNENRNRFKVRYRSYSSSDQQYFEIKIKNNKNRTLKKRLIVNDRSENLYDEEKNMISDIIGLQPQKLSPKLNIQFDRITLADKNFNERVTIDTNLATLNGKVSKIFNQLVISEVKQKKYSSKSDFIKISRKLNIPEMRFSKYCMGMMKNHKGIKYNRFKSKLLKIDKILYEA